MFGMGLGEVLIIAMVAIIFLGPDKLPSAMVQTAKTFKSIKKALTDAKSVLDEELKITELKNDANAYKEKLAKTSEELMENSGANKASREVKDLFSDLNDTKKESKNA